MSHDVDVVIVGGGHNGLTASIVMAQAGLSVLVLEQFDVLGGAVRTEKPFAKAPNLGTSTGAYLLGLMPPELMDTLGITLPTMRRDPHYFLPTTDNRYLLFGSDEAQTKSQFLRFFSQRDWDAQQRLQAEIAMLREDIAPTWLSSPLSIEQTAERHVRSELQDVFVQLCRGTIADYLARFDFESDLIQAMYAVTDAFSGSCGTWDTPGSGMNFLVHNMCRLPEADGTWMIVKGGMGTVSQALARRAKELGVTIKTGSPVRQILLDQGRACGVQLDDATVIHARAVVSNADPYRTQSLVGSSNLPQSFNDYLEHVKRPGTTLKVNMCLKDLPQFTCLPEDRGQFGTTTHLLPDEDRVLASLTESFEAVQQGQLPEFPTIEWYIHTTVDPSLQDEHGHHNSALFVQWVPHTLAEGDWASEGPRYVEHLLSICDRFAPNTSECVVEAIPYHPQMIESHFGITHGHIHHIDNLFGFDDRLAYRLPLQDLYACSAGCHPAGSVIGCAGHNAAQCVIDDLT